MENADFTVLRTHAGTAYGVAGLPPSQLRELLERPETLLWRHLDRPVKLSHETILVEAELSLPGGPIRIAYKQFRPRNWWKSLCQRFRPSRAMRGWNLARALVARHIATPRPLAVCEPCGHWLFRSSYLATEWIAGAENLHLFGWRLAGWPLPERLREASRCAARLGSLVGQMHAADISHRDLKAANLLAVSKADDLAVYLIDTDGVRIGRRPGPRGQAAELARLAVALDAHPWVTRSICCRFLRAYMAEFQPETIAWKSLWRDVGRRFRRIIRHKHRRGEQVL